METVQESDRELLTKFKNSQSEKAFSELVHRHGPMVYGIARRIVGNHQDAQDISQATFSLLARRVTRLSNYQSISGWIHSTTRGLALNHYRSQKRRLLRETKAMEQDSQNHSYQSITYDFWELIDDLIGKLPEKYQQPIILVHLQERSLQEASFQLNLNASTLRTRLERGRNLLREMLSKKGVKTASIASISTLFATKTEACWSAPSTIQTICNQIISTSLGPSEPTFTDAISSVATTKTSIYKVTNFALASINGKVVAALMLVSLLSITSYTWLRPEQNHTSIDSQYLAGLTENKGDRRQRVLTKQHRNPQTTIADVKTHDDLKDLIESVMMTEERHRISAIHNRLGLPIEERVYRKAMNQLGYQVNPKKLGELVQQLCLQETPGAFMQFSRKIPHLLREFHTEKHWQSWATTAPEKALKHAEKHLESKMFKDLTQRVDSAFNYAETWGEQVASEHKDNELANSYRNFMSEFQRTLTFGNRLTPTAIRLLKFNANKKLEELQKNQQEWAANEALRLDQKISRTAVKEELTRKDSITGKVVARWAIRDPDSALSWASQLEDEFLRGEALVEIAPAWILKHKRDFDLTLLPESHIDDTLIRIINDQATWDPTGAINIIQNNLPSVQQMSQIQNAVKTWTIKDLAESINWVESLPQGELKDASLSVLLDKVHLKDLKAAEHLVSQIADTETRHHQASRVISSGWLRDFDLSLRMAQQQDFVSDDEFRTWLISMSSLSFDDSNKKRFLDFVEATVADGREVETWLSFSEEGVRKKQKETIPLKQFIRESMMNRGNQRRMVVTSPK